MVTSIRVRKVISIAMVLVLTMGLITGCGGAGSSTAGSAPVSSGTPADSASEQPVVSSDKPVEITFWSFIDPEGTDSRGMALKAILENFKRDYPHITVNVELSAWDVLGTKFMAAHASKTAPDVTLIVHDNVGTAIQLGALEPFENMFLNDWTPEQLADIEGTFFDYASKDGNHYQFTIWGNYTGILYREDLFAQAGISLPLKTYDEFVDAAKKLTVDSDPETGVSRYGYGGALAVERSDSQMLSHLILALQGHLFTPEGQAAWSTDAGIQAMEMYVDLFNSGALPKTLLSQNIDDVYNDFAAGKYAMVNGTTVRVTKLMDNCVFDPSSVKLMPYPGFKEGEYLPCAFSSWSVGVWSGSEKKEAAGKFVEYLVNRESDAIWVEKGGQMPILKSTIKSQKDVLNQPKNQFILASLAGVELNGWPQPTAYPINGWRDDLNQAVQNVLSANMSPKDALETVEKQFNERNVK